MTLPAPVFTCWFAPLFTRSQASGPSQPGTLLHQLGSGLDLPQRFSLHFSLRVILCCSLCLILAACGSVPREQFYTLTAPNAQAAGSKAQMHWVLAGLTLPQLVDRPQLVVRRSPQQVQILEQQRWAEPLKFDFGRALGGYLQEKGIQLHPRSEFSTRDGRPQLWVEVVQFESNPGRDVVLEVTWQLRSSSGALLLGQRGLWREPVQGDDYPALIAAHQRALQQCASAMAQGAPASGQTPAN